MKNTVRNISVGIALLVIISAMVTGWVAYLQEKMQKEPVALSSEEQKKCDEIGENERILIRKEGKTYSLEGNKIIPVN